MTPMIPQVPFISTRPAAFPELLALAAAADAEGAAVGDVLPLRLPRALAADETEAEAEAEDILAGPDEVEDVEFDMVAFPLILPLADMLEFPLAEAETDGTAARLAVPPPMVEKGVHCEVAPAGCGAGVVGSP